MLMLQIEIEGILKSSNSIIIIDQILVTVGDNDSSRNMMYSLLPNEWCESTTGIRIPNQNSDTLALNDSEKAISRKKKRLIGRRLQL